MLIRSSLLWLNSDRVFLFDVQRSTSGYCMREYKHAYCSAQSYSASSSVQTQPRVSIALAFPEFAHARYRFAHAQTPRVLHFSAFIFVCVHVCTQCMIKTQPMVQYSCMYARLYRYSCTCTSCGIAYNLFYLLVSTCSDNREFR